ncbi:MAG: hypothetical protein ACKOE2_17200 [Actinomycetales bacterium]
MSPPMPWLSCVIGLLVLFAAVPAAPAAQAACDPTLCPQVPVTTSAELLTSPGAVEVTRRLDAMSSGPFTARTAYIGAGWESYQYGSIFFRAGVTRTSRRAFEGQPGKVTYLDTLTADVKARWTCRARKASDVDGLTWLRSWLPAENVPEPPTGGTWFVDYTGKPIEASQGLTLTLGVQNTTLWYAVKPTGVELGRVIRFYETDDTSASISSTSVPVLPRMSAFRVA